VLLDLEQDLTKYDPAIADFFKRYSITVGQWLESIQIPDKTISVHYGTSERIWSKIVRNRKNYSIDLPICSFCLKSYTPDENHNQPPEVKHFVSQYVQNSKPWFYKITYEISFWVKFLKEVDIINYQINSMFTPELYLQVTNDNWKSINGANYWIDCRILSKTDNIEWEPGDKEDRVSKIDMEIEVDAKLPFIKNLVIGKPIKEVQVDTALDTFLTEKKEKIKDNIQDDAYLTGILENYKIKFL
jgi:hypothetical protein